MPGDAFPLMGAFPLDAPVDRPFRRMKDHQRVPTALERRVIEIEAEMEALRLRLFDIESRVSMSLDEE